MSPAVLGRAQAQEAALPEQAPPLVERPPRRGVELTAVAVAVAPAGAGRRRAALPFVALKFRAGEALDALDSSSLGQAQARARLAEWAESTPLVVASEAAAGLVPPPALGQRPPTWNVLELARLLAPECAADDLDQAARFFGLEREEPGLDGDAGLLAGLFGELLGVLEGLDATTLLHLSRLAAPLAGWPPRTLLAEVERHRARGLLAGGARRDRSATPFAAFAPPTTPARRRTPLKPATHPGRLDADALAEALGPNGTVRRCVPAYEVRPQQVEMARLVAEAINDGKQALLEAPTGVGKSLAYLLPAAQAARENRWRVVVSTATTTLQDQLFAKDLPVVQASLGADPPLRTTVLKGRANYLCLRRWQALLQSGDLEPAERTLLVKTLFWLPRTSSGDRAELRLSPAEEEAWSRLSAIAEACTPTRCPYHRVGTCYLARARRAAEESHVVIVNHALLLSDLVNRARILPEYQVLVVDEAHHLEDEATQQLGWRIGPRELLNRLERLWGGAGPSAPRGEPGLVAEGLGLLRRVGQQAASQAAALAADLDRAERASLLLGRQVQALFSRFGELLHDGSRSGEDETITLRLTGGVRAGSTWAEAERLWAEASRELQAVLRVAVELRQRLVELPAASDEVKERSASLEAELEYWHDLRARLDGALHAPTPEMVYWLAGSRAGSPWLSAAPLEVASALREQLFAQPHASILVSATLAVDGSFAYVKQRLGLPDAESVQLGSPFDFRRAALVYVPYDLPDPTQPGYQPRLEAVLEEAIVRAGGRTLVLFTSRAQLRATYLALRGRLAEADITLLGQGMGESSRTKLLELFRRGSRTALFGTASFWEGIDVVGEALSVLVVTRLPFAVPTDPVYAARAEGFEDPFGQYAVPQAVLRFKQGFGRLIRSRADRGVAVILDRRVATRGYGAVFLRSLPRCTAKQGPASRTGSVVAEWLGARRSD